MPFRLVSILGSGALLVWGAGLALAAKPTSGDMYATSSSSKVDVDFKADSAKKLTDFSAGLALKCKEKTCGGYGGIKSFTRTSVKVTKKGTFTVTGAVEAESGEKLGTETVTGEFVSATEAKGKVKTNASLGQYEGTTDSFTATASTT